MVGESPAAHVVRRNERRVVEQELDFYFSNQEAVHGWMLTVVKAHHVFTYRNDSQKRSAFWNH